MDKAKKRQIKKYLSWVCIAAVVIGLTVMPLLAESGSEPDGPQASILSGTVETGSIDTVIHGGGTLVSPDTAEVTIPTGVKITEFLVDNGDVVTAGTPLAAVDRVSVMNTIAQVQETMAYLVEQMNEVTEEEASDEVTAQAGGRVKLVCARAGERVQDVMLRDAALAVLSLDGLMAVKLECDTDLTAGDSVTVALSDDTEITGRVESNLDGILTVTMEDDGYAPGESVTVITEDGSTLGTGEIYIHNAWKATAYTGTIEEVHVSPEETIDAETVLFSLTDTAYTAQLDTLRKQHQQYEELMLTLFRMYQSETIDSPCDGMVSGVDNNSVHLLSGSQEGWVLNLLVNSPNGDDETAYTNFVGVVTGIDGGNWRLSVDPDPVPVTDYKDLSEVSLDIEEMTQAAFFVPSVPVYELVEGAWTQIEAADIETGDLLLFACNDRGGFVWVVRISTEIKDSDSTEPTAPSELPTEPSEVTEPSDSPEAPTEEPTAPADPTDPSGPVEDPDVPDQPTLPIFPTLPQIQYPQYDFSGGFPGYSGSYGGTVQEEPEFELYDLEGSVLMTVTGQNIVTLEITLDEQDIAKITLGQRADVKIDALKNESFTAIVTSVSTRGINNGGSSKFTVELTMDKTEKMLAGMSAAVSIVLGRTEDVFVIPVSALVEEGAETIVYTGFDEASGELTDPVTVTIGCSDGIYAEILTGLNSGDSYYYAYYDTLELSAEAESGNSLFR